MTERRRTLKTGLEPAAAKAIVRGMRTDARGILIELLHNARRAGASRVNIEWSNDCLRLTDDGHGIRDPNAVLQFGRSSWQGHASDEQAAGIGLYALGRRDASIESRRAEPDETVTAWRIPLGKGVFEGDRDTIAETPCHSAPVPHGTTVTVRDLFVDDAERIVRDVARHMPLRVHVNGTRVPQEPFLNATKALRVTTVDGFHVALHAAPETETRPSLLEFHGTVSELPVDGGPGKPYALVSMSPRAQLQLTRPGYEVDPWHPDTDLLVQTVTDAFRRATGENDSDQPEERPEPVHAPRRGSES